METLDMGAILAYVGAREAHCALLLRETPDGVWLIDAPRDSGMCIPVRKASSLSAALRAMGDVYLRSAVPRHQTIRIGFAEELWPAAKLAGRLDTDASFLPLRGTDALLALLYSGSLRISPLV